MTETAPTNRMPLTGAARERLREQQRSETRQLAAVLAAQVRLESESARAQKVMARVQRGIAAHQATLDDCVYGLITTSGIARTAILLDKTEHELTRIARAHRPHTDAKNARTAKDGVPDVSA